MVLQPMNYRNCKEGVTFKTQSSLMPLMHGIILVGVLMVIVAAIV